MIKKIFASLYRKYVTTLSFELPVPKCTISPQRCFCIDVPKKRDVILFPGQGIQFVGMTKEMSNAPGVKKLFDTANKVLGYDLMKLCLNGPKDQLDKTRYCQPAVFVASLAAWEKFKEMNNETHYDSNNTVTAGFSVGEFAALVLSKALTFEDALRLVDVRAKAMQKASEEVPSGMVTVIGLDEQGIDQLLKSAEVFNNKTEKWCGHKITLKIANYLYSKGFVLAGHQEAINYVLKYGIEKHKATRTSQLTVSGAFHTQLMTSAQAAVANALEHVYIQSPQITVYSNVTGKCYESSEDIKRLLVRQLVEPVQWFDIMRDICASEEYREQTFYELGPGRQLTAILAKIDRRLKKMSKNVEA